MLGGMFAGHDESGGELVTRDGAQVKRFYGMSSKAAMERYAGGVAEYRAAEGKEVLVPYRGPVANTVQGILGGVRSACTYVGARRLKELTKRTSFIRVTQQLNEVFGK
jgi:GMP reductase